MELDHEFTVPVPIDQAWPVLLDVERIAPCMPGATLDSIEGDEFTGRLRVKLGAMTITYKGSARIASRDESAHSVSIEGTGKEARGSGTASATVEAQLHDEGEQTRVTVHTKLNVTGRPAQFGRNILGEVGGKLVGRFATNLAGELTREEPAAETPATETPAAETLATGTQSTGAQAAGEPATKTRAAETRAPETRAAETGTAQTGAGETAAAAVAGAAGAGATEAAAGETGAAEISVAEEIAAATTEPIPTATGSADPTETGVGKAVAEPIAETAVEPVAAEPTARRSAESQVAHSEPATDGDRTPQPAPAPRRPAARADDQDSINLLEFAGPSIAKRLAPVVAGVATLWAVRRIVRRKRRGSSGDDA